MSLRESVASLRHVVEQGPNQTVRNVLESKIHQSFTVTCDRLFALGLLDRDERIKLSGLIAGTLKQFGESIPPEIGAKTISSDLLMKLVEEVKSVKPGWYVIQKKKDRSVSVGDDLSSYAYDGPYKDARAAERAVGPSIKKLIVHLDASGFVLEI